MMPDEKQNQFTQPWRDALKKRIHKVHSNGVPELLIDAYDESLLPSSPSEGLLVWNKSRAVFTWFDGIEWEVPVVGNGVEKDLITVSDTTSEEVIWDADLVKGSMKEKRTYEVRLMGKYSTASTSDDVTINFYVGGMLIGSVQSSGKNSTNAPWNTTFVFTVVSEGENGSVRPHSIAKFDQEDGDDHHGDVSVDTTGVNTIEAKATWNNAKVDNTLTRGQGYMKEIS